MSKKRYYWLILCVQSVTEKSGDEFCDIILSTLRGDKVEGKAEWDTADRMPRWK